MCEWGRTVKVRLADKTVSVDQCIAPLVQALNDGGICTVASCCGHGKGMGNIALRDGRELAIMPGFDAARQIDAIWPALTTKEEEPT